MLIAKARVFAIDKHEGQTRKFTNFPYIIHPENVASLVIRYNGDDEMIAAAWLHDVVEDCSVDIKEIENEFGKRVSFLVDQLTIPKDISEFCCKTSYLTYEMITMSNDALLIKLCDRLDNVSAFYNVTDNKFIKRYSYNTNYILNNLIKDRRYLNDDHIELIDNIRQILKNFEVK